MGDFNGLSLPPLAEHPACEPGQPPDLRAQAELQGLRDDALMARRLLALRQAREHIQFFVDEIRKASDRYQKFPTLEERVAEEMRVARFLIGGEGL